MKVLVTRCMRPIPLFSVSHLYSQALTHLYPPFLPLSTQTTPYPQNRDGDGCINEEEFLQIMKGSGSF
jgi:hypothetical protein